MYAGGVQRVIPIQNTHKTRALLKGLGAQLGNLQKLFSVGKAPVCLSVVHNISRDGLVDAGDILQQGHGSSV